MTTQQRPLVDNKLKFFEKSHVYKVGNTKLKSVTKWVGEFFPEFEEKKIAKFVAAARKRKGEKVTMRQVLAEWKAIAQEGTDVHKQIQEYIMGERDLLSDDNKPKAVTAFSVVDRFRAEEFTMLYPEVRLYSEELGLAGTIDLLILHADGTATVVDWKTNKTLRGSIPDEKHKLSQLVDGSLAKYTLQLSAYALLLEDEYNITIKKLNLVHLEEGAAKVISIPFTRSIIEEMLEKTHEGETDDEEN